MRLAKKGWGTRNPNCAKCGDERGGRFGHTSDECLWQQGMTVEEVARNVPRERLHDFWEAMIDRYFWEAS